MPSVDGPTVVFAGGGTGGHLYPAIAIADALRARGARVDFVGTSDRLEAAIVPSAGYALHIIAGRPLRGSGRWRSLLALGVNAWGTLQSVALLRRLRPDVVVATGGYVCFPLVLAARALRAVRATRAPLVLFEPNATPGLTNRVLAPMVDEIWGVADVAPRWAETYVRTGIPVRASLRALPSHTEAAALFDLDPRRPVLLAMGGSQGARAINAAVRALVRRRGLPAGWQALLVTGQSEGASEPVDGLVSVPYLDDVAAGYAAADVVLARAGASTLAELAATGKPAILVPYPFAADDHQTINARAFAQTGAALVIDDSELETHLGDVLAQLAAGGLARLRDAAGRLQGADPLATIIARVDWLTARKKRQ